VAGYDRPSMPSRVILPLTLVAALLLFAAELSTIASVDVVNESCEVINDSSPALADRCELSGWERHGGALILLGLVALAAAFFATRSRSTGGGVVLVLVGLVILGITLLGDLPVTSETGAIGRDFDGATAQAGLGFFLELTGGLLCLLAGGLALLPAGASHEQDLRTGSPQREARDHLDDPTHDEADAGDQRERLKADVGIGHDDHAGGDPDHAEDR
jgi:hypothetical protein